MKIQYTPLIKLGICAITQNNLFTLNIKFIVQIIKQ